MAGLKDPHFDEVYVRNVGHNREKSIRAHGERVIAKQRRSKQ